MPLSSASTPGRPSPGWLLALGGALVVLAFIRLTIPALAWVTFAPFIAWLAARRGWRAHLAVLATLAAAMLVAVSKMATEEIPWAPVPMFALPMAFSWFVALTIGVALHRRVGVRHGVYGFAAAAVVLGWLQYEFTPGSSWGTLAQTQAANLPFVQLAALGGLGAMTLLVALGSSLAAAVWLVGLRPVRADLAVWAACVGAALLWGQWRLGQPEAGARLRIGGVVSPVTHEHFRAAMRDVGVLRAHDDELFARSARAADFGAQVVVWNEVATLVDRAGEAGLAARGSAFARERGVALLMAYGVAETMQPFWYTNKYRLVLPDGTLADEYVKRHPVPGDPHGAGSAHARVVDFAGARLGGAICYDFGFPGIARDLAHDGAEVALVPSSDWRGIDPEHALMARTNAVAAGLPMVRPVRAATSIVTDAHGRVLASLRADSPARGVLVADVPGARVPTLYARIGEAVPLAALTYLLYAAVRACRRAPRGRD